MVDIAGTYHLRLTFNNGKLVVELNPQAIHIFEITQEINNLLPTVILEVEEPNGEIGMLLPFDNKLANMQVEFCGAKNINDSEEYNQFNFVITKKITISDGRLRLEGELSIHGLFSPKHSRGFPISGTTDITIKKYIEKIATTEISIFSNTEDRSNKYINAEVSSYLEYEKTLIQPRWTNAQFLKYLRDNIIGTVDEAGFFCFVCVKNRKTTLVFKSARDFYDEPISQRFVVYDEIRKGSFPVYKFLSYDYFNGGNKELKSKQEYSYYNYNDTEYVDAYVDYTTYHSLSKHILIDKNEDTNSNDIDNLGRSNDFTSDFLGKIKGAYTKKLLGLSRFWITTDGLQNITPGKLVYIHFPAKVMQEEAIVITYSGYWMIEKVVHAFRDVYLTRLLLTRPGIDTAMDTELLVAPVFKVDQSKEVLKTQKAQNKSQKRISTSSDMDIIT